MKYIITESQLKLISELERDWRDFQYEEQYNKIKDKNKIQIGCNELMDRRNFIQNDNLYQ